MLHKEFKKERKSYEKNNNDNKHSITINSS